MKRFFVVIGDSSVTAGQAVPHVHTPARFLEEVFLLKVHFVQLQCVRSELPPQTQTV